MLSFCIFLLIYPVRPFRGHVHETSAGSNGDEIRATQNDIGPTQNDNESGSSQNDDSIRPMKNSQNRADGMMNVI